jgi:hypothetical protein
MIDDDDYGAVGGMRRSGPYLLSRLPWVALPGAFAPASIALRVTGAREPPLHDKAVDLEEDPHSLGFINITFEVTNMPYVNHEIPNS